MAEGGRRSGPGVVGATDGSRGPGGLPQEFGHIPYVDEVEEATAAVHEWEQGQAGELERGGREVTVTGAVDDGGAHDGRIQPLLLEGADVLLGSELGAAVGACWAAGGGFRCWDRGGAVVDAAGAGKQEALDASGVGGSEEAVGEVDVDDLIAGVVVTDAERGSDGEVAGEVEEDVDVAHGAADGFFVNSVTESEFHGFGGEMVDVAGRPDQGADGDPVLEKEGGQMAAEEAGGAGYEGALHGAGG